ncbi:MAG: hypothetical protein OEW39_06470 [Deltaproteobacteria bacterium]|nr:hypothetical protein [Deltaproteobacteria bacterium]
MFEFVGILVQGFLYVWMMIIASIPNIFMGGLTLCVAATVMTYFIKKQRAE